MLRINILYYFFFLFKIVGCNNLEYAKAVKEDSNRVFMERKNLIMSLEFNGVLIEKTNCKDCQINKYTIKIKANIPNLNIPFYNASYPPYYTIEDSIIKFSVNYTVFNALAINDSLIKNSSSRFLRVNKLDLPILAEENKLWIPK